jgi:hypothetical protein
MFRNWLFYSVGYFQERDMVEPVRVQANPVIDTAAAHLVLEHAAAYDTWTC